MSFSTDLRGVRHEIYYLLIKMDSSTTKHEAAGPYAHSFGSLNGTVCYGQVVLSMMHWINNGHEDYDVAEDIQEIANKAESWTSMRMQHLCSSNYMATDFRLFDNRQIVELRAADNYDDVFSLLQTFKDSWRLQFRKQ